MLLASALTHWTIFLAPAIYNYSGLCLTQFVEGIHDIILVVRYIFYNTENMDISIHAGIKQ